MSQFVLPTATPSSRPRRVADLLKREVARLIASDFKDPRIGMVTVTQASISPDLLHAKIFITVFEQDKIKETLTVLNHAAPFFRRNLGKKLKLRIVPHFKFIFDEETLREVNLWKRIQEANS